MDCNAYWIGTAGMGLPEELRLGYQRFRSFKYPQDKALYGLLALEQHPNTLVIASADSRVDPATIFSSRPGSLFVVRNVAALVPPYEETGSYHGTSAGIEFAVSQLHVKNIVVLGHQHCSGIATSLKANKKGPVGTFVEPWVNLIAAERDEVLASIPASHPEERQYALELRAIEKSLHNLMTFPFVQDAVSERGLAIYGAWFSISDGTLQLLNTETKEFDRAVA